MAQKVSRRKLAAHTADQILAGKSEVISQLAAFLIDSGRVRESELVVRDIETELARRGQVVVSVESATSLSDATRSQIKSFIADYYDGAEVSLRETVDPTLLGGVKIKTPGEQLDASLRTSLNNLKATKMKE